MENPSWYAKRQKLSKYQRTLVLSDELHLCCLKSKHGWGNFIEKVAILDSTLEHGTERKTDISSIVYSAYQFIPIFCCFISVTVLSYSAKYFRDAVSGKTKREKYISWFRWILQRWKMLQEFINTTCCIVPKWLLDHKELISYRKLKFIKQSCSQSNQ